MGCLDDIDGSSRRSNRDTEPQQKPTAHELPLVMIGNGGSGDDSTDDDQNRAQKHAHSPSPGINGRANEGKSTDTADLVHGRDQTSPDTVVLTIEKLEEYLVGSQASEKRTVKTIHRLTEETEKSTEEKEDGGLVEE
jgi:hypothetical protein